MHGKLLNLGLILTSLLGYLEWGQENSSFLFEIELDIMTKIATDPSSVMHPFIVLPLLGQVLLVITLFQKKPGKLLTFLGLGCIGILFIMLFIVGLLSQNYQILISTLPFLCLGFLVLRFQLRKTETQPR